MNLFRRTVRATKAILVAIALSSLAGMSLAADEEPYPIWWSPSPKAALAGDAPGV